MNVKKSKELKVGDRVHIPETRNSWEHDATIVQIRQNHPKSIGVRYDDSDEEIPWWYKIEEVEVA